MSPDILLETRTLQALELNFWYATSQLKSCFPKSGNDRATSADHEQQLIEARCKLPDSAIRTWFEAGTLLVLRDIGPGDMLATIYGNVVSIRQPVNL